MSKRADVALFRARRQALLQVMREQGVQNLGLAKKIAPDDPVKQKYWEKKFQNFKSHPGRRLSFEDCVLIANILGIPQARLTTGKLSKGEKKTVQAEPEAPSRRGRQGNGQLEAIRAGRAAQLREFVQRHGGQKAVAAKLRATPKAQRKVIAHLRKVLRKKAPVLADYRLCARIERVFKLTPHAIAFERLSWEREVTYPGAPVHALPSLVTAASLVSAPSAHKVMVSLAIHGTADLRMEAQVVEQADHTFALVLTGVTIPISGDTAARLLLQQ